MTAVAFEFLLILLLLVANGVFALAEIAMVSARRARLQQLAEQGDRGAALALKLSRDPASFLATVQIGITLVGILAGAFGGATIARTIADWVRAVPVLAPYADAIGLGLVVILITYLSLVIGELVPKRLALNNPEIIAARMAPPLRLLSRAAGPVVRLLSASTNGLLRLLRVRILPETPVSVEEIKILLEQGTLAGVFETAEQDIVESALHLDERPIGTRMTQRTDIVWLDLDDPIDRIRQQVITAPHSYFPVARGDLDYVTGILRARDLLAWLLETPGDDWSVLLSPPHFLPEALSVLDALQWLKSTGEPLVLIIDEYGGLQGLITPTDLLEALVGDIPVPGEVDEADAVQRADGSWLLDGRLPIVDTLALLGMRPGPPGAQTGYDTLGGFVMDRLGQVPRVGQHFDYAGHRFEVVDMDGRRVDRVLVSGGKAPAAPATPAGAD